MKTRLALFLLHAVALPFVAGDLSALQSDYSRMQTIYTERVEEIQRELRTEESEILNRFIVSLVRLEQEFREGGDLDGVVLIRQLREGLLERPEFPAPREDHPNKLKERLEDLQTRRSEIREQSQKKLDDLNRMFVDRLEPVMRNLTRAGDFATAREILELRRRLRASLGEEEQTPARDARELGTPSDPNTYPVSIEPRVLGATPGINARRPQIPFVFKEEGRVEIRERDFLLRSGRLTVPAEATEAMVYQAKQNQMFTLEFGFHTSSARQGRPEINAPSGLLLFGDRRENANLIVTHEAQNLFLYLRTTRPPENEKYHRVSLGRVDGGRMEHWMVTYRSGELTVYKDGNEINKIRGDITGLLNNWEVYPIHLGQIDTGSPALPQVNWNGRLAMAYLKASHESSRGVTSSYGRFAEFVTAPR
ncbi:MAG: hypothetical protein JJU29_00500 [Verrucomicrobia bacterium]|nr:hypothetical protein [Verrucomicrobiota bacterium]MCH8510394.1 DUF4982 domain-containing protein [Kiritimatiellia bacterium]